MEYATFLKSRCLGRPHPRYPTINDLHYCIYDMKVAELPVDVQHSFRIQEQLLALLESECSPEEDQLWCLTEIFSTSERERQQLSPELQDFFIGMQKTDDPGDVSEAAIEHYTKVTLPYKIKNCI